MRIKDFIVTKWYLGLLIFIGGLSFLFPDTYKSYLSILIISAMAGLIICLLIDFFVALKFVRRNFFIFLSKVFFNDQREEICVLLPLTTSSDFIKEDCELQIRGFGDHYVSLSHNHFTTLSKYKFSFHNHGNCKDPKNKEEIKKIVSEKLKRGTKYFISTMSNACEYLSEEFVQLSKKYGRGNELLICTVASSKDIKTSHQVLRLYIPAQQEIDKIYETVCLDNLKQKKFFVIYYSSKHPQECATDFLTKFSLLPNDDNSLMINLDKSVSEIQKVLSAKIQHIKTMDALCIFAYGKSSYFPIIKVLKKNDVRLPIYTSSTFYFGDDKDLKTEEESLVQGLNITTIRPTRTPPFTIEYDIVRYLFRHTVDKAIDTIENLGHKKQSELNDRSFFEEWKTNSPKKLKYEITDNGDVNFKLTSLKVI